MSKEGAKFIGQTISSIVWGAAISHFCARDDLVCELVVGGVIALGGIGRACLQYTSSLENEL